MDLPFKAEYAKSSRASCRGCKSSIGKDTLRLAVMVQSPMFDGKTPNWYHFSCFFKKQRPKSTDDIEHFESLRWDDQQKIKDNIGSGSSIVVPTKGKKRNAENQALRDFNIEYSKSSRATCRGCEQKIMKEEVRISKKDFDTDVGKMYGGQDKWHHLECFAKLRSELGYFASGDKLPGFVSMKKEDQKEIKKQLPAIKEEDVPVKKVKTEDEVDAKKSDDAFEKKLRNQNKIIFKYRDFLKQNLIKKDLQLMLETNDQEVPEGDEVMLDRISDIMTFGALEPCKVCKGGQYVFKKEGYVCHGNLTEWSKCNIVVKEPKRRAFIVPKALAEKHSFLKKYKCAPCVREFKEVIPTKSLAVKKEEDETDGKPKVDREAPALYNMEIVILGNPPLGKEALKKDILRLGGKVVTKIRSSVMAVISAPEEVDKMGARISEAQRENVHVVSEDFVKEAKKYIGRIPELVIKKSICNWGSDPNTRLPAEPSTSTTKSKSKSMYTRSVPSTLKVKLKDGSAIDTESGLENIAHVVERDGDKYTVILGLTDIQKQKNSFYKMQILQSDIGNKYWLFRSWGRIGTTIGGNKLDERKDWFTVKHQFCELYEEKTGNRWENRHNFVKVPGCMYPIDVDYGEEDVAVEIKDEIPSKLDVPVQNLIKMIFDVKSMQKLMMEFEIDTEKMPLGKLSKKQLQSAYSVLTELQNLINNNGEQARFLDASNRFYTLVPHSFGVDNPPVINELEIVKQKIDMLDNLMEMEIAYNLMKTSGTSGGSIDSYYQQLKANVEVLDSSTEEFTIIDEYVKNTHASTHSHYELEILQIFKLTRHGEEKRYKPFRKLHNRKLLWHGSRRTNFAGIISQGLRIAPPEAPVTGYMFGKGIYFADMVSKSANYCCTSSMDSVGLMLLCEVALGNMYERTGADYIEKLPKGKHSCKGVGRTHPDPSYVKTIGNNVEVPAGKSLTVPDVTSSLLYNEYIVYDVAQVKVKYLLQMDFKYKY